VKNKVIKKRKEKIPLSTILCNFVQFCDLQVKSEQEDEEGDGTRQDYPSNNLSCCQNSLVMSDPTPPFSVVLLHPSPVIHSSK
jgi:hypothetical protein